MQSQSPPETDELLQTLMKRYQAGDEEAFTQIYRLMAGPIERYLSRWTDSSRVGDLAQQAFLQMHRARRTYRPELPFRPWLYAIARHVALQSLRKQGRRTSQEVSIEGVEGIATPGSDPSSLARYELERAVATLPRDQAEAFWLAEMEGMTSVEISRLTGATQGAIRVRLHRAHQKLKTFLRDRDLGEKRG